MRRRRADAAISAILATAPDRRDLIARLQSDGQLPIDGLDDALRTAFDGHASRAASWPCD